MLNREEVEKVIEEKVRPYLILHGGDIDLIDVEEEKVKVKLKGACSSCPMSEITIKSFVEDLLTREFPSIKLVVSD